MASPLIPLQAKPSVNQAEKAEWTPTAEAVAQAASDQDSADWEYWHRTLPHAVEFAKMTVDPKATSADKQAHLRATLDTMTAWLKS